ncbi:MAG: hypothetical protein R3190_14465 [Thermoanaerobaculia bacterium]|nr:hypothetical protein [Thermoanaerobaculia bacterium]
MAGTTVADAEAQLREVLEGYAQRGVFTALSRGETRRGRASFSLVWHHGRRFRIVLDPLRNVVSFPALLPGVPGRSPMARELRAFLRAFETDELPPHRRVSAAKARLRVAVRSGVVSLAVTSLDGDLEYATRRLVHIAHEVFMVFLPDGPYDTYRVEHLGLDPDLAWG